MQNSEIFVFKLDRTFFCSFVLKYVQLRSIIYGQNGEILNFSLIEQLSVHSHYIANER